MKRFWWGVFFAALIGVLFLAAESDFSIRIRDLFFTVQDSIVALLDAAYADPTQAIIVLVLGACVGLVLVYFFAPQRIKTDPTFTMSATICVSLIFALLGLPSIDLGGRAVVQYSPTIAECRQCWAALPWHLAEGHVETGFGCRAATPF